MFHVLNAEEESCAAKNKPQTPRESRPISVNPRRSAVFNFGNLGHPASPDFGLLGWNYQLWQ
jgi:hypothetical protein